MFVFAKARERCLGNARSRLYCTRPYWRATRHDIGGVGRGAHSSGESMSFRLKHTKCAKRRNLPGYKVVISTEERRRRSQRRNLTGYVSDTLCATPRSVRSSASTLRKKCSKSPKQRTRAEGAGKGEFAFTERRYQFRSLAL